MGSLYVGYGPSRALDASGPSMSGSSCKERYWQAGVSDFGMSKHQFQRGRAAMHARFWTDQERGSKRQSSLG